MDRAPEDGERPKGGARADDRSAGSSAPPNPMPLAVHLGIEVLTDSAQEVVCRLRIGHEHLNQALVGHGGVLFALADTALGLLANRPGDTDVWVGTAFNLQLYRSVRLGDEVEATATLEHRGRRLTACRVEIRRSPDGSLVGVLTNELLPVSAAAGRVGTAAESRRLEASDPLAVALLASVARHTGGADGIRSPRLTQETVVLGLFVDDQPVGVATVELLGANAAMLRVARLVTNDADGQLEGPLAASVLRFVQDSEIRELTLGLEVSDRFATALAQHGRLEREGPTGERVRLHL